MSVTTCGLHPAIKAVEGGGLAGGEGGAFDGPAAR